MPKDYHLHLRGSVGGWNFDSGYVSYVLDNNKDKEVNVLINSLGGRVDTALAISSLFKIHGNVHVHFVGMNASAATIAAMGAKRVTIDSGACFLVHKCLNLVLEWDYMNADQLEAHIAELRKMQNDQKTIDSCIAGIYAKRCKKSKDELLGLMKEGGWLTPGQAKDWGFVDEITDFEEDEKPVLTDAVASALCSAGIPAPPIPSYKGSFFDRLKKFFSDLADPTPNVKQAASDNPSSPGSPGSPGSPNSLSSPGSPQSPQTLNMKNLPLLAALLGSSVALADGKVSFSDDQLSKIENALKDKESQISDRDSQISTLNAKVTELTQTVNDLKKSPAEDTSKVTENSQNTPSDGPGENIDEIVDALAKAYCS